MTLKHIAFAFAGVLVALWFAGFSFVLYRVWPLAELCTDDGECRLLETIASKLQFANVAALMLTASCTPAIILLMLIPFGIWLYRRRRNS